MRPRRRATWAGRTSATRGQFEILEIWTNETVTSLGSRKVLLRHDPNPYWHGCKPVVAAQTRPDLFEFQGIPETELVDHLQQAQWTLQNMVIDNLHLTTMRGVTYRAGGVTNPDALVLKPRFKWAVTDHDDIKPFEVPPISQDVFQERQRLLNDMQLVTGINPYISGSDLSSRRSEHRHRCDRAPGGRLQAPALQSLDDPVQGLPAHLRDVGRHDPAVPRQEDRRARSSAPADRADLAGYRPRRGRRSLRLRAWRGARRACRGSRSAARRWRF